MSFILHLTSLNSALVTLERALACSQHEHELVIDGSIQRFECCFELCWKTMREVLLSEGLTTNSPKETFKKAFAAGWIKDENFWLTMLEDRNLTTHTYFLEMAERIYGHLPAYCKAIREVTTLLTERAK